MQYKLSRADVCPFAGEMLVRQVDEITATGEHMAGATPTALGGSGGTHLAARDFHAAVLRANGDPAGGRKQVVIDTRNHYETAVGKFKGAVDPKIRCFAQFPVWLQANQAALQGAVG